MKSSCLGLRKQDYSFREGVSTHNSNDNVNEETKSISFHFTSSNLFQPNPSVNDSDSGDSKVCKSLGHSHSGTKEETASL